MRPDAFSERDMVIRSVRIRIKHWYPEAERKVIALHGWLDNAASFDALAMNLSGYSIVVPDLAGQGFSDKRPDSATCHLWDDLVDIQQIAHQLGWKEFSIIGHSRGAFLATLFAASFPEQVKSLVLLDGLMPVPVPVEDAPLQMRQFIENYSRERIVRMFESREQALMVRARAGGIPVQLVEQLAERQLRRSETGWYWDIDERLKYPSSIKMTEAHNKAFLDALLCPVRVILADKGWGKDNSMLKAQSLYPHFSWHTMAGHHHLHMDKQAAEVADLCSDWLR